tara:strand:- start:173 stop:1066 length:894 start_codon:yes stop_codon:yes gene_type:complete
MKNVKLLDGGTGTEIKRRGYNVPSHIESIWSAQELIDNPTVVEEIHYDYICAGADHIIINNYALTQPILSRANIAYKLEELTLRAIDIAKKAVKKSGANVKILGSLPPLETSYRADLILEKEVMADYYQEIASILKNKVDIIICETMASSVEAETALRAGLNTGTETWMSWTLQGTKHNTLPSGEKLEDAYNAISYLDAAAYLVNCGGANLITQGIETLSKLTNKPIGGYANSVLVNTTGHKTELDPERSQKESSEIIDEKSYSEEVAKWINIGASIVGGCCSTTPEHIKVIKKLLG